MFIKLDLFILSLSLFSTAALQYCLFRALKEKNKEIKNLKEQLIEVSRFSVAGELAGGLAHEVSSPLSVIRMRSEQILSSAHIDNDKLKKIVENIHASAKRITDVLDIFRYFVKTCSDEEASPQSLDDIFQLVLSLSHESFKYKDISIKVDIPKELYLTCRPLEAAQLFLYIILGLGEKINQESKGEVKIKSTCGESYISIDFITDFCTDFTVKKPHSGILDFILEKNKASMHFDKDSMSLRVQFESTETQQKVLLNVS